VTRRPHLIALLAATSLTLACPGKPDTADTTSPEACTAPVDTWTVGEIIDTEGCGILALIPDTETPWGGPFYVLRVEGSHYEMGYQHGRMVGPYLLDLWWTYMDSLAEEAGLGSAETMDTVLGGMMDTVWETWYGPNTPTIYHEEIQGFADGMLAAGLEYGDGDEDLIKMPQRIITLIDLAMSSQLNFDDLGGLAGYISSGYTDALLAYYDGSADSMSIDPQAAEIQDALLGSADPLHVWDGPLLQCSYFAAWGDRTDDGGQYMTRNMDFSADTGIWTNAAVAVYVPDDGVPYASISWLGANLGILAGISREGIAVSAVGAESPFERIATEPALLRARDALEHSTSLDDAMPFLMNDVDDGINRAPTIGYNALVSWGDPRNDGADAQAVILESNGLETGIFHHHNDCTVTESLIRYDLDGVATVWTHADDPEIVNTEADAKEIDGEGNVRLFQVDEHGDYVLDENNDYIEVETDGQPIRTGYPLPCALYRGDEAMAYGVRIHQAAANGPMRDNPGLMIESGSYTGRYQPMYLMTMAYEQGTAMEWDGGELIPDNSGEQVKIGMDQTELISRTAAMNSNVWDVVYDTTDLAIRVSYEGGTGESWVRASEQPSFLEIDLNAVFLTE
jgi:hypothetical protein